MMRIVGFPKSWPSMAAALVLGVGAAACLAYALVTMAIRPLDGVEGEVLFEAARLRAKLPLYVDPLVGVAEYGEPRARFFVLYPPLWSWMAGHLFFGVAFARIAATVSWYGSLLFACVVAKPTTRLAASLAALFAAASFHLGLYGTSGRPDAFAVALAGLAFCLALRRGGLSFAVGVLFAFAAWTKPNVVGLALGAAIAGVVQRDGRGLLRAGAGVTLVSLAMVVSLHAASDGTWWRHLIASTGQAWNFSLWSAQMTSRLPFFGLPLLGVLWGLMCARTDARARWAVIVLGTSTAWTCFSLGKIGSASNYWMEPLLASVYVLACAPAMRWPRWWWFVAFAQIAWTVAGSVQSAREGIARARIHRQALDETRTLCAVDQGRVVVADEPGLEVELNGRLVDTPFQMANLVRTQRFSASTWLRDITHPRVSCLLVQSSWLEEGKDDPVYDRFPAELRAPLQRAFVPLRAWDSWRLYRKATEPMR